MACVVGHTTTNLEVTRSPDNRIPRGPDHLFCGHANHLIIRYTSYNLEKPNSSRSYAKDGGFSFHRIARGSTTILEDPHMKTEPLRTLPNKQKGDARIKPDERLGRPYRVDKRSKGRELAALIIEIEAQGTE